jgi:hypothetical protein
MIRPEFWQGLVFPVIGELGSISPNYLLYGVFGQVEVPRYLPDLLPVPVVCTTNFTDRFHYQHLLSLAPLFG